MRNLLRTQVSAILVAAAALGGCANFETVRTFAKDGSTIAAAARQDADRLAASCRDLRAEQTLLAYAAGGSGAGAPSRTCDQAVAAMQTAAQSLSVQLLVRYHEALLALAGDEHWTLTQDIEALGAQVRGLRADGQALVSEADVARYQGAFAAVADGLVSALRERAARDLLRQPFDWPGILRPLRFWYGGPDGRTASLYSEACRIVRTDWTLVQGELQDYARCDRRTARGAMACEPLTAGARLLAIDAQVRPLSACATAPGQAIPEAALARVRLIDGWIEANEAFRQQAFDRSPQALRARLATLRAQVKAIQAAVE